MTSSSRLRAALLAVACATTLMLAPGSPTATARQDAATRAAAPSAQPNVVVVMADDMRVDELLFAPRIRRLVGERGLTFENSFSPHSVCCPARASFFTGIYTHRHGVYANKPPYAYGAFDDSATLATSTRWSRAFSGSAGRRVSATACSASSVRTTSMARRRNRARVSAKARR